MLVGPPVVFGDFWNHDLEDVSSPKPIKFRECELSFEVVDIVPYIENKTSVIPAVLDAAQASANHLEVEVGTVHWASDYDGPRLGCIEPLSEYSVIDKSFDFSRAELLHNAATYR